MARLRESDTAELKQEYNQVDSLEGRIKHLESIIADQQLELLGLYRRLAGADRPLSSIPFGNEPPKRPY